jgi:hypothetical protein
VFAFERSPRGAHITMHRMGNQLQDISPGILHGTWSAPNKHCGTLEFSAVGFRTVDTYVSPKDNIVHLQIDTTTNGESTKMVVNLKKILPAEVH